MLVKHNVRLYLEPWIDRRWKSTDQRCLSWLNEVDCNNKIKVNERGINEERPTFEDDVPLNQKFSVWKMYFVNLNNKSK